MAPVITREKKDRPLRKIHFASYTSEDTKRLDDKTGRGARVLRSTYSVRTDHHCPQEVADSKAHILRRTQNGLQTCTRRCNTDTRWEPEYAYHFAFRSVSAVHIHVKRFKIDGVIQ